MTRTDPPPPTSHEGRPGRSRRRPPAIARRPLAAIARRPLAAKAHRPLAAVAQRLLPWGLRLGWAALPFSAGGALGAALHAHSQAVRVVGSTALWIGWAAVLVATLVPHPIGLTTLRLAAPTAVGTAAGAALQHHPSALALGWTLALLALAFAPETGRLFVNGPAYPNERRFPLRPPGPLLLGPLPLAAMVVVGGPVGGALLLAARSWVAGAVLLVVGSALALVLARSLHGLSRRWVVFVPAGMVLHDPIALADPVLFRRQAIERLRPAPAGTDSLDLTQGALGLALELVLREKVPMVLSRFGDRGGEPGASARLLFTPSRPGAVLAEAAARRITVG